MSALERVRQWARENRDPSILEVFRRTSWWSIFITAAGPLLAVLAYRMVADVSPEVLSDEGKRMLAIFVLAACYWITGAIPPFATAILIIGLEVFLLGVPAASPSHDPHSAITGWEQFVSAASAPIIVLMLGGFVLSQAAHKHGLDRVMAVAFIKPFGTRPRVVLLGIMLITANFSMWMSNTATAAMMITLIAPIAAQLDENSPLRKSFFLAVPLAANIGGMGTPIGTPPNAIAFGALQGLGIHITFIGWMVFAIPLMVMMLLLGWVLLIMFYPPPRGRLDLKWAHNRQKPGPKQWIVYATFSVTVGLWVTSHWTGIPIAAVALLPVVVFTATRLLDRYDINHLDWDILLLMAGGLALGSGMKTSGLAGYRRPTIAARRSLKRATLRFGVNVTFSSSAMYPSAVTHSPSSSHIGSRSFSRTWKNWWNPSCAATESEERIPMSQKTQTPRKQYPPFSMLRYTSWRGRVTRSVMTAHCGRVPNM